MIDIDPVYLIYALVAVSTILVVEAVYLLFFSTASYRNKVNRRLRILKGVQDRESILIQLRRERGLTKHGDYKLPVIAFNRLVLQSGLTMGMGRLGVLVALGTLVTFAVLMILRRDLVEALAVAAGCGLLVPLLLLKYLRARRQKAFGAQFPDGLDIIVRSLRAGHPVPIAIAMVAREMKDPIGSEFGTVGDELTYGADLETAMRNLYYRVGQDDLPLFVTAVAIQSSTGGNLGEILENLSGVIRQRFKMRRKVRALAAEGRASALILSSLPLAIFALVQLAAPQFYASVWNNEITKIALAGAGGWMGIGNLIMYRLVNFRI